MKVRITKSPLPKAQNGMSTDDAWIRKIFDYESKRGSARGTGLSNWGYNSRKPKTLDEAVSFFKQDYLPKVQQYPMGMRERAADFMYNTGEDPRLYMLDQYVRKYGNMQQGLPGRADYRAKGSKNAEFESLYSTYQSKIDELPLEERISLLDQGRDFYYRNLNTVNGKPSAAYNATWKPRLGIFGQYKPQAAATQQPAVQKQQPVVQQQQQASAPVTVQPLVAPPTSFTPQQPFFQTINKPVLGNTQELNRQAAVVTPAQQTQPSGVSATGEPIRQFSANGPVTPSYAWSSFSTDPLPAPPSPAEKMYEVASSNQGTPVKDSPAIVPIKKFMGNEWMNANQDRFSYGVNKAMEGAWDFMRSAPAQKAMNVAGDIMNVVGVASPLFEMWDTRKKTKAAERSFREMQLSQGPTDFSEDRGDYDMNTGMLRPDKLGERNKGQFANAYYTPLMEEGGQTTDTMKIRIIKTPSMEYGGQLGYGFDLGGRRVYTDMPESTEDVVSNTLGPVPEHMATIEAEKGETMLTDVDGDGMKEHMKIGGKRHSEGGTPLAANSGDFVFSDTKKMTIKDPEVLKAFGSSSKKGSTPAQLAKKYDINKYKAILDNPNSDAVSKRTAQLMIQNHQNKLGRLAMVQEAMKGFPDGIPAVAQESMEAANGVSEMAYGGYILPKAQKGRNFKDENEIADYYRQFGYTGSPKIGELQRWLVERAKSDPSVAKELTGYLRTVPLTKKGITTYGKKATPTSLKEDQLYNQFNDNKWAYRFPKLNMPAPAAQTEIARKYMCTPNGVVAVRADGPYASMQAGLFDTYEQAQMVCSGASEPAAPKEEVKPNQNTFSGNKDNSPFGFMTPDVVNMYANAAEPPEVTYGYRPQMSFEPGNYALEDWRSKAQARQSGFNSAANTMATYGPTTGLAANLSFMAGQTAEGVTQDIAGVDNRNVDRANIAAATEQQRKDPINMFNTIQKQELWKDNAIARQQFHNAKRNYLRDLAGSYSNAWNNRMNLGLLNTTNPMYNIDPTTGRSYFKGGYDTSKLGTRSGSADDQWQRIGQEFQKARAAAGTDISFSDFLRVMGYNTSVDRNGDGVPDSSTRRNAAAAFGGYITYPF